MDILINATDIGLYVTLAMKNLFFPRIQTENVVSEVQRLVKQMDVETVKSELANKHWENTMIITTDIGLYVTLAMKNLFFSRIQTENVASEVQRLVKQVDVETVKSQLMK